ncbi:uncharacterized protein LOC130674580 [Microplitis mediator]|uniref:uncharacterized protein LOC130674580 n=1 Tax=Microplitis mediator TaxID=375433 RepID=UPI0025548D53|nr:uncharacterized protein LOC130674580 [Microplitis mediator]
MSSEMDKIDSSAQMPKQSLNKSEVHDDIITPKIHINEPPNVVTGNDNNHFDGDDDDQQLFGPTYNNNKMVNIGNNVYCTFRVHSMAINDKKSAHLIARTLISGVFKTEAIFKITLSGRSPRAQGRDRMEQDTEVMNMRAKEANYWLFIKIG